MSEILQNVHSLAVTDEVVRQKSREGSLRAALQFLAPVASLFSHLAHDHVGST